MLTVAILAGISALAPATPPDYKSFKRPQQINYQPNESELLRIWVIYVGQGDALLIQFPKESAPSPDEPIEMLVDGGPPGYQLLAFLKKLYPRPPTIEHAVLTHHDSDHVMGLINLLEDGSFPVSNLYHNGLASWALGGRVFPGNKWPARTAAILNDDGKRGMARFKGKGPQLQDESLVKNKQELAPPSEFAGEYRQLANAVQKAKVHLFPRTRLDDTGFPGPIGKVKLTPLWPPVEARGYGLSLKSAGDWSHTINGNSVVFRLDYGDFSMLFTGDLNEASEQEMLDSLGKAGRLGVLHTDVLKVPHHGSSHGLKEFFDRVSPVVSVASMGSRGFNSGWKHPSTEVIEWLGGPHRVYHTYIQSRRFLDSDRNSRALVEEKHILIETDGRQFRIADVKNPVAPFPDVREVARGCGTQWISAAEQPEE